MPHTKVFSLRSATGLLTLAISTLLSPANLRAQTDQTSSMVGSWIVTVPGIYTDSGKPQRNGMVIFAGGGGMFIDKPSHGNGVIVWKQTADRQFAFTIVQISYGNNGNGNNGNGGNGNGGPGNSSNNNSENGTVIIKGVATLNSAGDSLSFIATGQVVDLDGNAIDSFSVTLTGDRVQM